MLRVIVEHMVYPVTLDVIFQIFSRVGKVLKIVTFTKNNTFQALIQVMSSSPKSGSSDSGGEGAKAPPVFGKIKQVCFQQTQNHGFASVVLDGVRVSSVPSAPHLVMSLYGYISQKRCTHRG